MGSYPHYATLIRMLVSQRLKYRENDGIPYSSIRRSWRQKLRKLCGSFLIPFRVMKIKEEPSWKCLMQTHFRLWFMNTELYFQSHSEVNYDRRWKGKEVIHFTIPEKVLGRVHRIRAWEMGKKWCDYYYYNLLLFLVQVTDLSRFLLHLTSYHDYE